MAICKCKMCGGDLNITELDKVVECEYCGTTQTVPSADNEKKMTLFNRANKLRFNCEFDKAAGIYESIIADFPEEAEAYWGVVLCKYGIEYVDDPATGKKIPTCHRSSFDSVMEDDAFEQACENADAVARRVYREEAKHIEEIRKGIIEVSSKEEPYDIFICYKETDEAGGRTEDSAIAQDVYTLLVEKGYRVFFSRVSLADKVGQEYEPYIFAALNSAKIMLVFGTDYEYFNAVWVKNEWSRFLQLIAAGQKKTLIPCFKDIDAYDLPKEFVKLQSVDLGNVGALTRLLQSIEKIIPKTAPSASAAPVQAVVANPAAATVESLLKRAFMFLEDGNWQSADEYAEKVLDINPEKAEAYLAKAMVDLKVKTRAAFADSPGLEDNSNIAKAMRFGSNALQAELNCYIEAFHKAEVERIAAEKRAEDEHRKAEEEQRNKEEECRKATILKLLARRKQLFPVQNLIAAGANHTVGLCADGTVVITGRNDKGQCNINGCRDWINVFLITVGADHAVGLRADGTVAATGDNGKGQCDTGKWRNIVAVAAGANHTAGLCANGTVVVTGNNGKRQCNTDEWRNVVAVATGYFHTVGLRADGTVIATGDNDKGQCDTGEWRNIVAVAAGKYHTVGLCSDGTVVAVGYNEDGQCDTKVWRNVVMIAAGANHTVGLCADGTVIATKITGKFYAGQCETGSWTDVVAIAAGDFHTVGLRADGTVVATGKNDDGRCNTGRWRLFFNFEKIEEERATAAKRAEEERAAAAKLAEEERIAAEKRAEEDRQAKIVALTKEKADLEAELPTLKGLFKAGRRKEVEVRLAEIEAGLTQLGG